MLKNTIVILLSLLMFPLSADIKIQSYSGDTSLPHKLLKATLDRANLPFSYPYSTDKDVSNARILNDVKSGSLDVMWSMTSKQLETEYQAIYYPLFRGLLGMRLAIVKDNNTQLFSNVHTLQDLKRFVAGQGKTWPDTKILEHNSLDVAKTLKYPNLFFMLEGERFDYFPRGINEPWDEIKRHSELKLAVEPYLIIRYRAPLYFFVNKNNLKLQQQLNESLETMVQDGTFSRMFFEDQQVKSALSLANVKNRRVIDLENPLLTDKTPINRKELWFNPLTFNAEGN